MRFKSDEQQVQDGRSIYWSSDVGPFVLVLLDMPVDPMPSASRGYDESSAGTCSTCRFMAWCTVCNSSRESESHLDASSFKIRTSAEIFYQMFPTDEAFSCIFHHMHGGVLRATFYMQTSRMTS